MTRLNLHAMWRVCLFLAVTIVAGSALSLYANAQVLLGDQAIESSVDSNTIGTAEAFQTTASTSGTVGTLTIYLDTRSTATKVYVGLYADNNGHPGTLLSQGSGTTLAAGTWNTINVPQANVASGTRYWIAVLGTTSGTVFFRDRASGSCKSESSSLTTLASLPATWATGQSFTDCPLSAYGSAAVVSNPVLSVSPPSLAFSADPNGSAPAPATINVSNLGGGTLNFTAASDSAWLAVAPASGTAPQALQASVSASGLAIGNYTGHVTITDSGAQGSPATVTVNLKVAKPADWLTVDHDPSRSGNAANETILSPTNAGSLQLTWTAPVDGPVTAQPLFAGAAQINGQTHDVLIVATGGNSIYALDASTGATLWRRNFGVNTTNGTIPGGFGVTGAPVIDRVTGRIYAVSDDGSFRTVSLADGTEVFPALSLIAQPITNKVWGGLNQVGNNVYFATASDGSDTPPWTGILYRMNVTGSPVVASSFVIVPSIAGTNKGGGIWGYGGVAVDPATGQVYGATGADSNETYTPYADRMIALDANLNLLGSFGPPEPTQFPCNGSPCDLDFGATPVVFQPNACPTMVAVGNKNGNLYLYKATDLAASAQPFQILTLNTSNDSLGNGGVGGVPAFWQAGNMLFVTDAGPGSGGTLGGVVGLNVTSSCTLQVAWSKSLGGGGNPNSTPTIANGVVFVGEGATGRVHAYNAQTGTELWNSGSTAYAAAATFAAPIVAQGNLYAGSWSNFTGGGMVGAFSLNTTTQVLAVSPTSLSFSATQGGSNPAASSLTVTNSGTGTMNFTAASDSAWLSVSPASGTAPQGLQVAANINGLAAGTYNGNITITATGAQGSPAKIPVTLVVSTSPPPSPVLSVAPTTVSFAATQGGSNPSSSTVNVTNTGGGTLTFTTVSDASWLTASPTSGTAPRALQLSANINGLTQGSFTGHVTVTAAGAQGSPATVTASLTVNPPPVIVFGEQTIETQVDSNARGIAEAFQTTATATGTISSLAVYLDASSTAAQVYLGLYADNGGHPGALLTQGNTTQLSAGAWNIITVPAASVTSGTSYWIAILGTTSGTPFFRDRANGPCKSETNKLTSLTSLPSAWTTGTGFTDCPISAYGK